MYFFLQFSRGEHLAVLNTYDSFFICKTMQNIFAPAQKVPIKILLTFLEFANRYRFYVIVQDSETVTSDPNFKLRA